MLGARGLAQRCRLCLPVVRLVPFRAQLRLVMCLDLDLDLLYDQCHVLCSLRCVVFLR